MSEWMEFWKKMDSAVGDGVKKELSRRGWSVREEGFGTWSAWRDLTCLRADSPKALLLRVEAYEAARKDGAQVLLDDGGSAW